MFPIRLKAILLAALAGLLTLSACAAPTVGNSQEQPHTISVSGTGTAYGKPDLATVQIGVQSRNTDPAQAVADANAKIAAIMDALKGLGIEDKDIQTTNFSVSAQQDYDPETGRPQNTFTYVVDNTLSVAVRDLSKVGEALGQAVEAGANSIYGVSFSVSDMTALEAEARGQAMADAKARAEQLAQAAGVTLAAPMSINEFTSGPIPYAVDVKAEAAVGGAAPVPISTGQVQVTLQVNVTYTIK